MIVSPAQYATALGAVALTALGAGVGGAMLLSRRFDAMEAQMDAGFDRLARLGDEAVGTLERIASDLPREGDDGP